MQDFETAGGEAPKANDTRKHICYANLHCSCHSFMCGSVARRGVVSTQTTRLEYAPPHWTLPPHQPACHCASLLLGRPGLRVRILLRGLRPDDRLSVKAAFWASDTDEEHKSPVLCFLILSGSGERCGDKRTPLSPPAVEAKPGSRGNAEADDVTPEAVLPCILPFHHLCPEDDLRPQSPLQPQSMQCIQQICTSV